VDGRHDARGVLAFVEVDFQPHPVRKREACRIGNRNRGGSRRLTGQCPSRGSTRKTVLTRLASRSCWSARDAPYRYAAPGSCTGTSGHTEITTRVTAVFSLRSRVVPWTMSGLLGKEKTNPDGRSTARPADRRVGSAGRRAERCSRRLTRSVSGRQPRGWPECTSESTGRPAVVSAGDGEGRGGHALHQWDATPDSAGPRRWCAFETAGGDRATGRILTCTRA